MDGINKKTGDVEEKLYGAELDSIWTEPAAERRQKPKIREEGFSKFWDSIICLNTDLVQTFTGRAGRQKDEITVRCLPSLPNAVNTRI